MSETKVETELVTDPELPEHNTEAVEESAESEPAEEGSKPNREAARYRKELRQTQSNLTTAQTALTAARGELLRNAITGHKVGGKTFNLEAFDDAGIDPDALFTEDGTLNTEAIDQTMMDLAEAKPYLFTGPPRMIIPNEGGAPDNNQMGTTWADALNPRT